MIELGYRSQRTNKIQLDIEEFQQNGKNLTTIVQTAGPQQFYNVPTTSTQIGTTLSMDLIPNSKIQFKPFSDDPETETEDLASLYLDPSLPTLHIQVWPKATAHKYTPGSFGGFYFNYRPTSKINIDLTPIISGTNTIDGPYDSNGTSTAILIRTKWNPNLYWTRKYHTK